MFQIITMIFRTIIIYLTVTLAMRCMGKRQIGEMSTAEISVTLLISEVASSPVTEPDVPLYFGILIIAVLVLCEIVMSYFDLKFSSVVRLMQGDPAVIAKNGEIMESSLRKSRVTVAELNEALRLKNMRLSDVYIAIIETNGQLSIIPKNEQAGVTRKDLNVSVSEDPIDFAVVIDGKIKEKNLKLINKDKEFVYSIMHAKKIPDLKSIFVMYADSKGLTYLQTKENKGGN